MAADGLLRYRAERLLRKDFSGLRPAVLRRVRWRLAAAASQLDMADLEECYGQAWHALYTAMLAREQIDDVAAWLVEVTFRRAIDELRDNFRQEALSSAQAQLVIGAGAAAQTGSADMAARLDDRVAVRRVLEALSAGLNPRERRAATLCYVYGLSRAQAARALGVSVRRMRKLMDGSPGKPGVAAKADALLKAIGAGEWCEQQSSLMHAYALGLLDPLGERHSLAAAHARDCPSCRAFVLFLRGLASVLPPLPLPPHVARLDRRRARRPASSARNARMLLPKLALAGVAVLGVAAERAPVADRAAGHAMRHAAVARPPAHPLGAPPARRLAARAGHRAERPGRRFAHRTTTTTATSPVAGVAPSQAARSSRPSSRRAAPFGEFTPEQAH